MEIDDAVEDLQQINCGPANNISLPDLYEQAHGIIMTKICPTVCIVGTAGIGKTTLARLVFNQVQVESLFEICAWVIASQSNDVRQIMIDILDSMGIDMPESEYTSQQVREYFFRSLKGRKYLIVLDDVCDTQVLDDLLQILRLQDSENDSRILVTTRLEDVYFCETMFCHRMTIVDQFERIRETRKQAESLLTNVSLSHDILKNSSHEIKSLENHILDVRKRVKDLFESCFIEYNFTFSPECLTEVKRQIDLVKQLVIKIDKEEGQNMHSSPATLVGNIVAEDFTEIKNKLAEQSPKLKIVSLVGMGGIGKTTLAKQVYKDAFFIQTFPIRAWVRVSQSYDLKQVLCDLLKSMGIKIVDSDTAEDLLSQRLYQSLKGHKYLIVIDDVWDTTVLDDFRRIFPDDKLSSRILLTTRLDKVADYAKSYLHRVHLLNENESWNLFCRKVFGEDYCPPLLKKIGKNIVQNCKGLPLAIIVIGGLLSSGTKNLDYWISIAENLTSFILSNEDDHCSKILSLSYTYLPNEHLKKCFLYTGIFLEDIDIPVSELVKLWVAEGFLETLESNKLMEDTAYESLLDLIGRSLLLVGKHSSTGKIKTCKIHDVVREFCMREAKLNMCLHISDISLYGIPTCANVPLRLSIHPNKKNNVFPCDKKKLSSLEVSTLHIVDWNFSDSLCHLNPKPLRVFGMDQRSTDITEGALNELLSYNLQYLSCYVEHGRRISIPSTLPFMQTLIIQNMREVEIWSIWSMPQLRHVKAWKLCLPHPLEQENSGIVLENLQTLSDVYNFKWSKEVVRRCLNLKRLGITYVETELLDYSLENLVDLHKLEALTCSLLYVYPSLEHILTFTPLLKKLTLKQCCLPWKDLVIVASSLPNLEVLKLKCDSFEGQEWESSTEEEFPKLKFLLLQDLDLELWRADSVNFPSLQRLIITLCSSLKEIPRCIGEIQTLQLIEVAYCTEPLADLVKEIQEEQLEYGNDGLEVLIN